MSEIFLYFFAFLASFIISAAAQPLARRYLFFILKDSPTQLKNHEGTVPSTGGAALALGFFAALLLVRFMTNFPSGTLHNLRGIFFGGTIIFALGVIDDIKKPKGLNAYVKLFFQIIAALILIKYDISIKLFGAPYDCILSVLWIAGLTNAFNLIDIMDGLAVSQAVLASLAFALISLPSEFIYVNFAALALCGAALGFWPYNHAKKLKTFLGDGGSTLLGFILAALALGAQYSAKNPWAVFVPILILIIPIFDTCFVSVARLAKGISPLRGTNDHFPLRLMRAGLSKKNIVLFAALAALSYDALAFWITKADATVATIIYAVVIADIAAFAIFLRNK